MKKQLYLLLSIVAGCFLLWFGATSVAPIVRSPFDVVLSVLATFAVAGGVLAIIKAGQSLYLQKHEKIAHDVEKGTSKRLFLELIGVVVCFLICLGTFLGQFRAMEAYYYFIYGFYFYLHHFLFGLSVSAMIGGFWFFIEAGESVLMLYRNRRKKVNPQPTPKTGDN